MSPEISGLVTPETDRETGKKTYAYDPHLDPRTIIEAVRKRNGRNYKQASFFNLFEENPPLREAILRHEI